MSFKVGSLLVLYVCTSCLRFLSVLFSTLVFYTCYRHLLSALVICTCFLHFLSAQIFHLHMLIVCTLYRVILISRNSSCMQGVWRNPVEEIERAGSFGSHLHKTIYLLLQFLHEKRDYHLLYQLHTQLQRTPEQEK